eukprot:151652_1
MSKCTKLNNYQYIKLLKSLHYNKNDREVVSIAFNEYNKINELKNHYSINKLLKICVNSNHKIAPNKTLSIWDDIINTNNMKNISQGLVVRSCSNALKQKLSNTQIKKCTDILYHILSNNNLKDDTNVYCLLIHAFGLCGNVNSATQTFNSLPSDKINLNIVCSLMTAYINNKQYEN